MPVGLFDKAEGFGRGVLQGDVQAPMPAKS